MESNNNHFRVVFQGELVGDRDPAEVKLRLCKLFKAEPSSIERLFSGKRIVLKKDIAQEQAERMRQLVAQCGAIVMVEPQGSPYTPPANNRQQPAEERREQARRISESFEGELPAVIVPLHYKLGLTAVGIAMVLIPLIYLSIIAASGYIITLHATENLWLMSSSQGGKSGLGGLLLYLAPIVIGTTLILFMLKPLLLLLQSDSDKPIELSPERETELFRFVHTICDKVNAAKPSNIILINEANAYASFYQGVRGLLGNRLTLAIGMPLVAGMNSRQLAGVLAHEFGHFAQGAGMRMTYLIRTINYWLYSAVYGRDRFDSQLDNWANNAPHIGLMLVLQLARLIIWSTRKLLWLLMMAGQYISSLMLRQMEFDADRYEARLVGAEQFADTSRRLNILAYAASELDNEMYQLWMDNGFVLDDMPRAITDKADSYSRAQAGEIIQLGDERKTGAFDTHPADHERIANALREKTEGIFRTEAPARTLFAQYDKLCKQVTRHFYAFELKIKVKKENLLTLEQFKSRMAVCQQDDAALTAIFGGSYRSIIPLPVPKLEAATAEALLGQWQQLCPQQQAMQQGLSETLRQYDLALDTGFNATLAECFLDSGFRIKHTEFGLQSANISHALQLLQESRDSEVQHYGRMISFNTLIGKRLAVAGALLATPLAQSQLADSTTMSEEFARMRSLQQRLNGLLPALRELLKDHALLSTLLNSADDEEEFAQLRGALSKVQERCEKSLHTIQNGVSGLDYPFEHSSGAISLYDYLFTCYYPDDELRTVFERGNSVSSGLLSLLQRVTGRLCTLGRMAEQACSLECPAAVGKSD